MINMPLDMIIEKLKEGAGISEEAINEKIDAKLKQLSGLISKEGAAHIIANELGVKIFDQVSGKLQIKNILSGMRSVETVGKVVATYEVREFETKEGRKGKVGSMLMGDETGTIRVVCWGSQADNINNITPGTIVKIAEGYAKDNQGRKELHINDSSKFLINPDGETVGEVIAQSQDRPAAVTKKINQLVETDNNVAILGTIVQSFEPKFYEVCPECGKRARMKDSGFECETHKVVQPDYSYVMNVILDDGTENIRAVFFRDNVEKITGMNKEALLGSRTTENAFESLKTELLGNIIKITGRVTKNDMFGRLEIVANDVDAKPNPQEEIDKLNAEGTPAPVAAATPTPDTSDPVEEENKQINAEVENIN